MTRGDGAAAPEATLTIRLLGRAKVQITVTHYLDNVDKASPRTQEYYSHYEFFHTNQTPTEIVLHDWPLRIERNGPNCQSWDFALTIPTSTCVNPRAVGGQGKSWLSLDGSETPQHALPPSIASFSDGKRGQISDGYVEYYLEAVLETRHGDNVETVKSTLPISMRSTYDGPQITDTMPRNLQLRKTVYDFQLVPGSDMSKLSLKQKAKKWFGTPSVPHVFFTAELNAPTCLQLDHMGFIPLSLCIRSVPKMTSEILHGVPQTAVLNSVSMSVHGACSVGASNGFLDHGDTHDHNLDLGLEKAFSLRETPITIPVSENAAPVSIGDALKLRLTSTGLLADGSKLPTSGSGFALIPDFVTYNLAFKHNFAFTFSISIAGQDFTKDFRISAKLIPAPTTSVSQQ